MQAAGHGALKVVSRITGLARSTINRGEDDLDAGPLPGGRVRRKGGGGRPLSESDPTLVDDLRRLVEPATLGSPVQPLRWVSKSREKLARALGEMGHKISANTVGKLLTEVLGFSRQVNRKADEGSHHPDRNAQFEHINAKVVAAQAKGEPVISVDTKKKELVGNYRNAGSDYRPQGELAVDFKDGQIVGTKRLYADGKFGGKDGKATFMEAQWRGLQAPGKEEQKKKFKYLINNGHTNHVWQNAYLDRDNEFVMDRWPYPFIDAAGLMPRCRP